MKKTIVLLPFLASFMLSAQVVTFPKGNFAVGERVTASVAGGGLTVENDFTNSSFAAKDGNIDLGVPKTAGFYRVNFRFLTGEKSFLFAILEKKPGFG